MTTADSQKFSSRELQLADDALPGPELDAAFLNTQLTTAQRLRMKCSARGVSESSSNVTVQSVLEERIERVWETPGQAAVRTLLVNFEETSSSGRPRRRTQQHKVTSARTRSWRHQGETAPGTGSTVVTTVNSIPQAVVVIGKSVTVPSELNGSTVKANTRRKSFVVEDSFFQRVPQLLERSVAVPDVYFSSASADDGVFVFILEDLRGRFPNQHSGFTFKHAQVALAWLARFHATFWEERIPFGNTWDEGTFWNLTKRPIARGSSDEGSKNHEQQIRKNWETSIQELELRPELHSLCEKLLAKAEWLDEQLSCSGQEEEERSESERPTKRSRTDGEEGTPGGKAGRGSRHRTMLHGDFKAENILFAKADRACAAVDFQWSGAGYGARDVMYLLCSASCDKVRRHSAAALRQFYFQRLEEEVRQVAREDGRAEEEVWAYSWEEFERHYELALSDFVRFCIADGVLVKDDFNDDTWLVERAAECVARLDL